MEVFSEKREGPNFEKELRALEGLIFRAKLKYWRTVSDYRELGIDVFRPNIPLAPEIQKELEEVKREYIEYVRIYFSYPAKFDSQKVARVIEHSPAPVVMTDIDQTYLKGQGYQLFQELFVNRFSHKKELLEDLIANYNRQIQDNKIIKKTLWGMYLIVRSEEELARHLDEIYYLLFDCLPINELRDVARIAANPHNTPRRDEVEELLKKISELAGPILLIPNTQCQNLMVEAIFEFDNMDLESNEIFATGPIGYNLYAGKDGLIAWVNINSSDPTTKRLYVRNVLYYLGDEREGEYYPDDSVFVNMETNAIPTDETINQRITAQREGSIKWYRNLTRKLN